MNKVRINDEEIQLLDFKITKKNDRDTRYGKFDILSIEVEYSSLLNLFNDIVKCTKLTIFVEDKLYHVYEGQVDKTETVSDGRYRVRLLCEHLLEDDSEYKMYKDCVMKLVDLYMQTSPKLRDRPLHIGGIRRIGNSTVINDLCKKLSVGKKVVVVHKNNVALDMFKKTFQHENRAHHVNMNNIETLSGRIDDIILINDYSVFTPQEITNILYYSRRQPIDNIYIGLG